MAERYAKRLLSEATGGKIGGEVDPSETPSGIDFKDRRALLDTIVKLLKEKNSAAEEDESSMGAFKEMMNGINSGEDDGGGDTPPSAPSSPAGASIGNSEEP